MSGRRLSFTTRYMLLFCILLLIANSALGMVVLNQSKSAMSDLIDKDMLDIVNSAAGSLDGDVLGLLTEDDVDGPAFQEIERRQLDADLSGLSENVDALMGEMAAYSGFETPVAKGQANGDTDVADELEVLGGKNQNMQAEMSIYLEYLHTQAYTDALTKVSNSTAYHEATHELDERIADGNADFWVIVCDINGLKQLNDTYGHECGDLYIQGAAHALTEGFSGARVYRIGGDEFCAIAEDFSEKRIEDGLRDVTAAVDAFNESSSYPARFAVSQGTARFISGQDASFKDVFARADQAMYEQKRSFYRSAGGHDRRRS